MKKVSWLLFFLLLMGCQDKVFNRPYPDETVGKNIYFSTFSERPKHLDPARSYSSNEWAITNLIYEAPYQYHYLKRPYALEPLLAQGMPKVKRLRNGIMEYTITIKPNLQTQPHPAFTKLPDGTYKYHNLENADDIYSPNNLDTLSSVTIVPEDFVRAIKRLADPSVQSPIFGLMSHYIVGLASLRDEMMDNPGVDIDSLPFEGAKVISEEAYVIYVKDYPQFQYWLAMPFFAPMPKQVLSFYNQEILKALNISLDWWPVGTGPYFMTHNNPAHKIVLTKNPNFHGEIYPSALPGAGDATQSLAGQSLPFIEEIQLILEKESIPRWQKFLQGYYDMSGVSSDSFDQAIQLSDSGATLSSVMKSKGISLDVDEEPSIFYWGFNMLDPIVGHDNPKGHLLRQAISIAIDTEEYISIFLNGRGLPGSGPLPPGIFGYNKARHNPITHDASGKRYSLEKAKSLMIQAGYPNGVDSVSKKPLIIYYDTVGGSTPEARSQFSWMKKQFSKLGIQLVVRDTQYNRFQDKMKNGTAQFFGWGWNADYPDPENFFFLLASSSGKVKYDGENAANYSNPTFDQLFNSMRMLPNGVKRQATIDKMVTLLQQDAPWVWGYYPTSFALKHNWIGPYFPHALSRATLKYVKLFPEKRVEYQSKWNAPQLSVLLKLCIGVLFLLVLCLSIYIHREYKRPKRIKLND